MMDKNTKIDLITLGVKLGKNYTAKVKAEAIMNARDSGLIDPDMALELALELITDADRERRE